MKKCIFLFVLAVAFIACNKQPQPDCGTYPYCISDFSIHPDNWICGTLRPEPSPFDENDTVVAMKIKYVYDSDMNGLTYFTTKNKELFSLFDESGNREDSIFICTHNGKSFVLYPYKSVSDLSPEVIKCDIQERESMREAHQEDIENGMDLYKGCLNISYDGVLVFDYEMEIQGGQTYDKTTETGDTIHLFEISDNTHFDNVFYPI